MAHCVRHFEEPVMALCRTCGQPYCSRCLVFAFGPKKPPYCVSCALTASGVRVNHKAPVAAASTDPDAVPANDQRVERAARRAQKAAAKAAAKEAKKRRGDGPPPGSPEPRPTYVPAPTTKNATSAQPV